jgi:HEAT repeat protein
MGARIDFKKLRAQGARALPALVGLLEDGEISVRQQAAQSIGALGAKAVRAVPALMKALASEDRLTAWPAAEALGKIGPDASAAIGALAESVSADDLDVAGYSAEALFRIATPKTSKKAAAGLGAVLERATEPITWSNAAFAIAVIGAMPGAAAARHGLEHPPEGPPSVDVLSEVALARISGDDDRAIVLLSKALSSADEDAGYSAARLLGEIALRSDGPVMKATRALAKIAEAETTAGMAAREFLPRIKKVKR